MTLLIPIMIMIMTLIMMPMLMTDVVSCYVHLHGFGVVDGDPRPDWYRSLVLNGVDIMNVTGGPEGTYTYIVDADSCSASDYQYFDTYDDPAASGNLISYVQTLPNGGFVVTFYNVVILTAKSIRRLEQDFSPQLLTDKLQIITEGRGLFAN